MIGFPKFWPSHIVGENHTRDVESSHLRQEQEKKKKMQKYKVVSFLILSAAWWKIDH